MLPLRTSLRESAKDEQKKEKVLLQGKEEEKIHLEKINKRLQAKTKNLLWRNERGNNRRSDENILRNIVEERE